MGYPVEFLRARRNRKWSRYPPEVLPAWVADMDFAVSPGVQEAIERLVRQQDYGYPFRGGDQAESAVAEAFAIHAHNLYDWDIEPDSVQPVMDLIQAMYAAILAFSDPTDGIILQLPAYPPLREAITGTGRCSLENPMVDDGHRWRIDIEALDAMAPSARLLLFCNPHNPTGRVFDRDDLLEIERIAEENDLIIVSDEIHSELVYPGNTHIPIATVSPALAARTVTITSATKSHNIAGLRCGVMQFGSRTLQDNFYKRVPRRLLGQLSSFAIDASIAAWSANGHWLNDVVRQLETNRSQVTQVVRQDLPQVGYHSPEATYFAWLDFGSYHLPTAAHEFLLDKARVALHPGGDFGTHYSSWARLNFATSPQVLAEILTRVCDALPSN